ncbi:MYND-type zinc finger-containing chromatin reader Zmynd8 [Episyrphus balteatus]|uniref:MYND-type zinc finger-containing chromatin reader Zmynd8 n=1 Tax=Episyrphus balteatus TaxID=286459 RepID=UPI00248663A1|nr:MYND-type zinc finger-containing chromatin reader Zmynd8 [Episyrphus balteatus]
MNRVRRAPPSCIRFIYRAIAAAKFEQLTLEQLVKILKNDALVSDEVATQIITQCINDKILIPVVVDHGRGSPRLKVAEGRPLSLPTPMEIPIPQHDHYCFECHLPGNLEPCLKCPRAFHRECYRKDPEKPNYEIPSAKVQKNPLPEFNSDCEQDINCSVSELGSKSTTSQLATNDADNAMDSVSVTSGTPEENKGHFDLNVDMKSKVDVMCLGETRPPNRSRRSNVSSSYAKNEVITTEDDDDHGLCTSCRLSKCAALRNPPNLESDELCYLLNFTYTRNITWITADTIAYLDSLDSDDKDLEVLQKVLLRIPIAPKDISQKIESSEYKYLMEFLIDTLDLQHNIGVLFGDSTEMDSTKWLVRDITHDLAEIGRCPDCFRYSNHKKSKGWFCKPCVQRHELVFAKHPGFPFWPAKVIRVLPNNKYDVRFFGGDHSRALVDVKNIRPIDTDPKQLKLSKGHALKSAMEELKHHQLLLHYPPSQFSFRADRAQVQAILERVLMGTSPQKQRRSDVAKTSKQRDQDNEEQPLAVAQNSSRKRKRSENISNPRNICHTRSKEDILPSLEVQKLQKDLDGALKIIKENKKKQTDLTNQIKTFKEAIAKMERNMETIKRKQWCFWCFNEAILLCCFKASYCSEECQKAHWEDGHSKVCKNRDLH